MQKVVSLLSEIIQQTVSVLSVSNEDSKFTDSKTQTYASDSRLRSKLYAEHQKRQFVKNSSKVGDRKLRRPLRIEPFKLDKDPSLSGI